MKKFNAWTRTTFGNDGISKNVEHGKLRKRFKFPKHFFKEVASDNILKEKMKMFRSSGYQADQIESCLEKLLTKWTVTSNNGGDLIVLRSIEEYPWRYGEAHAQRLK